LLIIFAGKFKVRKRKEKGLNVSHTARAVVPNDMRHITQSGNDRQNIFQVLRINEEHAATFYEKICQKTTPSRYETS